MYLSIIKKQIEKLSNSPGVYIFKDKNGEILYVGKATSLKSRVSSYFQNSRNEDRPVQSVIERIKKIEVKPTESVLEALFLEAELIKKYQPKYNAQGKDDKSFSFIVITQEEFPRILVFRETDLAKLKSGKKKVKIKKIFGPYGSKRQIEVALRILRKIFPFHSRKEKSEKGCLESQIGLCPAPYDGGISPGDYSENIKNIILILSGKKKRLVSLLKKEMENMSRKKEFEKAAILRNQIFSLEHIQDVALLKRETSSNIDKKKKIRIEAYDISNISGKFAVGSMVVFVRKEPMKDQYRKFKIKTIEGSNDVGMMAEVLFRRFRNDWQKPDLILLDGGKGHLNMAGKVIKEFGLKIPLVSVAKGPSRKNLKLFISNIKYTKNIRDLLRNKEFIKEIMDEAHRFAVSYHKKIRDKSLI